MQLETLIVGQGIAGTTLALQMEEKGKDYAIIDNNHNKSSSLVAAGLYNPVVFRKPSLSFNAHSVIPYLKTFYEKWETKLETKFHQNRNIIKLFTSVEDINNWEVKSHNEQLKAFLSKELLPPDFNSNLHCDMGAGKTMQSGNVYVSEFLNATKTYFNSKLLQGEVLNIRKTQSGFTCLTSGGEIKSDRVILSTGHINGPQFEYLPLNGTKGDILTIYCSEIEGMDIINKGFFIMPLGDGFHRVGATFEWDNLGYQISEKARVELNGKLKSVLKCDFKIEDQHTGLRPTVGDRRPLLGEHPDITDLYLFNGLGSKGIMLAPYYSEQLVNHIFDNQLLEKEVDIKRYMKHYGNTKN
ncbi:MAG: NAD(P)/FAD-dependent oxidoreductase [Salibacteraceae bacterium]